jgi:peptidoglycan/LPS O-acetylase OafA/YrhL
VTVATEQLHYRPALDGLRAVAVVAVLLVHLEPSPLPGGGLGVDVFFALSGFLITTLVLEELRRSDGGYRFGGFYARRALRLFPALYAALLVMGVYVALRWDRLPELLLSTGPETAGDRGVLVRYFVGAATCTSNLIGVTTAPGNFFTHTWSLAVEEQFYLIWPVILVAVHRRARLSALAGVLIALAAGSLILRVCASTFAEGLLWQRLDAIILGSAFGLLRWSSDRFRRVIEVRSSALSSAGLVLVVLLMLLGGRFVPEGALVRGGYTLFAALAALTVCALAMKPIGSGRISILEHPVAVRIGLISYGLYVWHLPAYQVVVWEFPDLSQWARWSLQILASVALAVVSFRVVEQPFRRLQSRFRSVEVSAGNQAAGLPGPADDSPKSGSGDR